MTIIDPGTFDFSAKYEVKENSVDPDANQINTAGESTGEAETVPGSDKDVEPVKPETLQISRDEINFMQEISFLVGDSPRTIKRYINIYRIIRTHSLFEFNGGDEIEYYYATMFLLSVITGLPEITKNFFELIQSAEPTISFEGLLANYLSPLDKKSQKLTELSALLKETTDEKMNLFSKITLDRFQCNLELVSRFSFRNVY